MIPFPKIHIAESVMNRIFNALEGEQVPGLTIMEPPFAPDPIAEGVAIEEKLETPPAPAAPADPELAKQGMVEAAVTGGSPFDGALMGSFP